MIDIIQAGGVEREDLLHLWHILGSKHTVLSAKKVKHMIGIKSECGAGGGAFGTFWDQNHT